MRSRSVVLGISIRGAPGAMNGRLGYTSGDVPGAAAHSGGSFGAIIRLISRHSDSLMTAVESSR